VEDCFSPPKASLFWPSSKLVLSRSGPGALLGAGFRPRGWRRLFAAPAREWADRVDETPPLAGLLADEVRARFAALTNDDDAALVLDELFRASLRPATADDEAIAEIQAALVDPAIASVTALACATRLSTRQLERISHRAFGFAPKLLLRRARFLRSLHAMRAARRGEGSSVIDPGYTDYSHFIRDSHDFLGMSPQAFLEIDMPLLKRSLELRKQVLGTPAQALDGAPPEPADG
jgi:AraC-like DNA-binding protein